MHNLLEYITRPQLFLGNRYGLAIGIVALVLEILFVLYGRKEKLNHIWIYVGVECLLLLFPVAYIGSLVLHMNTVQQQILYYFIPGGLIGAYALTAWYEKAAEKFGKKILIAFLLGLILLVGQPWGYGEQPVVAHNKLDAELTEVALAMDEGTATVPRSVALQVHKVQQKTSLVCGDAAWYEDDADITTFFDGLKDEPVRYVVLPKADYNQSYMDLVGYVKLTETEHYEIYVNPAFDL